MTRAMDKKDFDILRRRDDERRERAELERAVAERERRRKMRDEINQSLVEVWQKLEEQKDENQ